MSAALAITLVVFGWFAGVLLYAGTPWVAGLLPFRARAALFRWYISQMESAFRRFCLVVRKQSGLELKGSAPGTNKGGGEKIHLDGRRMDWEDPGDKMSYLGHSPFGIVLEHVNVIVDPIMAEAGARKRQLKEATDWVRDLGDLGVGEGEARPRYLDVPRQAVGVSLEDATQLIGGGEPPTSVDTTWEWGVNSQLGFKRANRFDILMFAIMFAIGVGIVYITMMLKGGLSGGGGGGGGTTVGLHIYGAFEGVIR